MLCELAHSFPPYAAKLLERDKGLRRNFREESITDVLMASLVGLQRFGIRVDFPDEPTTGGDMDWIFAAPKQLNGGRYVRLLLQAKRAKFSKLKSGGYWFYEHLDHGNPKGSQASQLLTHANTAPDGMQTCPLYILYHPTSALASSSGGLPDVQGVNLIFADIVAPVVMGGCGKIQKRVDQWRPHFLSLPDVLCWPTRAVQTPAPKSGSPEDGSPTETLIEDFHPDDVARRLNNFRHRPSVRQYSRSAEGRDVVSSERIPPDIMRAIYGEPTIHDRQEMKRPRIIFSTDLIRK